MFSHYYKFLLDESICTKYLKIAEDIDKQGFQNINYFEITNSISSKTMYTYVSLRTVSNKPVQLHVIFPGIDFGLSSHLFTAWDILYEAYLKDLTLDRNVDYLVISPLSAIGNKVSVELLEKLDLEKYAFIKQAYSDWVKEFIKSNKYDKVILHGMSAGCNYAYLVGKELCKTYKVKLVLDNPSLLFGDSQLRKLQIITAFVGEGLYRNIFDRNVRLPMKYEKDLKNYLTNYVKSILPNKKLSKKIAQRILSSLLEVNHLESYEIDDVEVNIGKYDLTIYNNKMLAKFANAKVNILNSGHFINRLSGYF